MKKEPLSDMVNSLQTTIERGSLNGGGIVITGSMVVAGVGLVYSGYQFGSWVKNKFF